MNSNAMCLDDIAESDQLFQGLGLVAEKFAGAYLEECRPTTTPEWLLDLPTSVRDLHGVLTRWDGLLQSFAGGYGIQDSLFLPPNRLDDGGFLLIEENQGGFRFRVNKSNQSWIGTREEASKVSAVRSIAGFLTSFALQEMVMSAPLWAIDEGLEGYASRMMADMTLIWTDTKHGGYMPHSDVQFYWHSAGAIVVCDERGRGDIGCHDPKLATYFERFGFYDIR